MTAPSLSIRWLQAPFVVLAAFCAGGVIGAFSAGVLLDDGLAGGGLVAAVAVVTSAWLAFPNYKWTAATVFWLGGSALAWYLLHNHHVLVQDPADYSDSSDVLDLLPLKATLSGGLVAWLCVSLWALSRYPADPSRHQQQTPP